MLTIEFLQTIGEQNDEFVNIMQKMLVLRKEAMATIETARRGQR